MCTENPIRVNNATESTSCRNDWAALFALAVLASPFKSRLRLQAENAVLRHQLNVLRRRLPGRVRLTNHDRERPWRPRRFQIDGVAAAGLEARQRDLHSPAQWAAPRRLAGSTRLAARCEFPAQVMCADASFHANQARRYIGEPRFNLAPRHFCRSTMAPRASWPTTVERVLADIDANHGDRGIGC